jgi:hypothetical protein
MDTKAARRSMLCSEIISLHLQAGAGRDRQLKANLEEIWPAGAILWTDVRIRQYTSLWFLGEGFEFRGQVIAHTVLNGLGYFIEMQFDRGCSWSEQKYRPKHLFNPLVLLANRLFETTLCAARSPFDRPRHTAFARTVGEPPLKIACGN